MCIKKLFKDSVKIYTYSESLDSLGDAVKTWTNTSTIMAFINDNAGGEKFQNGSNEIYSTAKMFCDLTVTLTAKMRLQCVENSKIYDILYVNVPTASLSSKINFITADLLYNSEASL